VLVSNLCAACTIANSNNFAVTCKTSTSSQANTTGCFRCNDGFYLVDVAPPTADSCVPCTAIANSNGEGVTCSSSTTSMGNPDNGFLCNSGYWSSNSTIPHACVPCTAIPNSSNQSLYCSDASDSRGDIDDGSRCSSNYYPANPAPPQPEMDPRNCVRMFMYPRGCVSLSIGMDWARC
jgi:hypothetical protein